MVARAAGARPPRAATVARGVVATANMLARVVMTTRGARISLLLNFRVGLPPAKRIAKRRQDG